MDSEVTDALDSRRGNAEVVKKLLSYRELCSPVVPAMVKTFKNR
ncbi:hypothetical protein [Sphaerochaeta pleomorpha]|nr:hypothetical protein [Sphaerochaeta pleomorpha]